MAKPPDNTAILKAQVAELTQQLSACNAQVVQVTNEKAAVTQQLVTATNENNTLKTQNAALQQRLLELTDERAQLTAQIAAKDAKIADLEAQLAGIKPPVEIPPEPLPPSTTPVVDAVTLDGLATGRCAVGSGVVIWVDDNGSSKLTIVADALGNWSQQLTLPPGTHHLNGYDKNNGSITMPAFYFQIGATGTPPGPDPVPVPSPVPIIDGVDGTGLARGRGGPAVIWVDDDNYTKTTVNAGVAGQWLYQFHLPKLGNHHISGYAVATGAGITGAGDFVTTTYPPVPALPARLGLANKYVQDVGIGNDLAVFVWLNPTAAQPWLGWQDPAAFTTSKDPVTGLDRMHMQYKIGDFSPCIADWLFSKNGRVGPDKCYMRYYWSPKADFQCTQQPKKLPGLAGRYGNDCGNGGNYTTGRREPEGFLCGWSARTKAWYGASDTDPIVIGTYLYWADMGTGFGNFFVWDCAPIYPDDVPCIEICVAMNTVLGPFDALGNGVGQYDGVLQAWVNGIPALNLTNLRYRHNKDIHVDEVWLDHFHGGTTPAEKVHSFWMGGVVAASEYIGPVKLPAPATQAVTVYGNNTLQSLGVPPMGTHGQQDLRESFACWSSGIWNPDTRTFILAAGGEYVPGPVVQFNKATGLWSVASAMSTQVNGAQANSATAPGFDSTFDKKWCMFSDGVAAIGHTYDTVCYVPAAWRITGPQGALLLPIRDVMYTVCSSPRPVLCDSATKVWKKAAGDGPEGIAQTSQINTGGGGSWVLDLPNRRYFGLAGATSRLENDRIATLTFADTSGIGVQGHGPTFAPTFVPRYPVQLLVQEKRRVVIAGAGEDYSLQLQWYDADKLDAIYPIAWQGDSIYGCAGLGITWCPWAGCFMALPCTSPTYDYINQNQVAEYTKPVVELFRITPNWSGGAWTIARVPISGAVGYTPTFTGKRLFADVSDQTVNWVSSYTGKFFSLKVPI